jgi:hypothetical protein
MKSRKKWRAMVIAAPIGAGTWYILPRGDESVRDGTLPAELEAGDISRTRRVSEERDTKNRSSERKAAEGNPALKGIRSPIARRYLSLLMAEDGRFVNDPQGPGLVNNAFAEAWLLTSRMDLTEEQQDRLAEFLLEVDWFSWVAWLTIDPERIDGWAKHNLTVEQQATLKDLLAERKDGIAAMNELWAAMEQKHGDLSDKEIKQKPAEVHKELDQFLQIQQAYRDFNLLADRIPMTAQQQEKVHEALRSGEKAPVAVQDYQMLDPDRAEAAARADSAWLGDLITEAEYETYIQHFLAQVEMSGFHL